MCHIVSSFLVISLGCLSSFAHLFRFFSSSTPPPSQLLVLSSSAPPPQLLPLSSSSSALPPQLLFLLLNSSSSVPRPPQRLLLGSSSLAPIPPPQFFLLSSSSSFSAPHPLDVSSHVLISSGFLGMSQLACSFLAISLGGFSSCVRGVPKMNAERPFCVRGSQK